MSKRIDLLFLLFFFSEVASRKQPCLILTGVFIAVECKVLRCRVSMIRNGEKLICPTIGVLRTLPGQHHTPFDPNAISQVSGGFTVGGTGWYRKTFTIGTEQKNKRIHIQFDGVYMNADFWLNGESLGTHPYGYTSFWFDITDKIKFGEKNTIIVQVKNEGQNSRWYSGSGYTVMYG